MGTLSKISRHLPHYLPLVGIYVAGALAFWMFSYDRNFQVGVAVALAMAHVCWGAVHHSIHKDLSLEVLAEYVTVALLGLVVLLSIIYRS